MVTRSKLLNWDIYRVTPTTPKDRTYTWTFNIKEEDFETPTYIFHGIPMYV